MVPEGSGSRGQWFQRAVVPEGSGSNGPRALIILHALLSVISRGAAGSKLVLVPSTSDHPTAQVYRTIMALSKPEDGKLHDVAVNVADV